MKTHRRIDRTLTLSPLPKLIGSRRGPRIPILMYHGVSNEVGARHPYFETNISPEMFDAHLQFLRDRGYTGVHLPELLRNLADGRKSDRLVAITFDDAYLNFFTHAYPRLRKHGFKATLYAASALVGKQGTCLGPEPIMNWEQLREVSGNGIEIGSHSVSHRKLHELDPRELEDEVKTSKAEIENRLGSAVRSFAHPFAFPEHDKQYARAFASLLKDAGYDNGVTTVLGTAAPKDNRFWLPRLPVNTHDDLAFLEAKLNGHYDWLHAPQYRFKALKAFARRLRNRA